MAITRMGDPLQHDPVAAAYVKYDVVVSRTKEPLCLFVHLRVLTVHDGHNDAPAYTTGVGELLGDVLVDRHSGLSSFH